MKNFKQNKKITEKKNLKIKDDSAAGIKSTEVDLGQQISVQFVVAVGLPGNEECMTVGYYAFSHHTPKLMELPGLGVQKRIVHIIIL